MDKQPERTEDFAQLIARLKAECNVNESEIARAIGVAPATVNAWALRKRGVIRGPGKERLLALHKAYPNFASKDEIFAAAGRVSPGPLSHDAKARIMALLEELTEEQQELQEVQIRAVVERNHSSAS